MDEIEPVWQNFLTALGGEVRPYPTVYGKTGIEHQFLALAVDEKTKRLLLISNDPDPKVAALTQSDIQATMPDMRVIIARPIVFDLGGAARHLASAIGTTTIDLSNAAAKRFARMSKKKREQFMQQRMSALFGQGVLTFKNMSLPALEQIASIFTQAKHIDWTGLIQQLKMTEPSSVTLSFERLARFDNLENDRRFGVCPVPLYAFTPEDWELFKSKDNLDQVTVRLKDHGIYQYYFPSADELTLGFVEKGQATTPDIERALATTDRIGHPFGENSLIDAQKTHLALVDALLEIGLLVSGEFSFELSPEGLKFRSTVNHAPKESLLSKAIKQIKVDVKANVDPTKLITGE